MRSAFLTPRWLGLHVLLVVSVAAFGRTGIWQWTKASSPGGSWQNYGYGVQWWLFAAFAVFLYVKLVLDELDPSRAEETERPPSSVLRQPQAPPPADDEDDELAAYNRHLAFLAEKSRR